MKCFLLVESPNVNSQKESGNVGDIQKIGWRGEVLVGQ